MKINHLFSTAVLLSALSVMFTGCDDKEFTAPVLKPEAVETPVDNINANIAAVRSFVQAKETGSKVRKTTVLPEDAGFMVEFSDGNTVSLRTKVGALADFPQQPDTYTPTVAAMPDEDGVYYWTIDGEWLTSATRAGEKINVTGAKAVTPRVSINENGDWVVDALDYGKTVESRSVPLAPSTYPIPRMSPYISLTIPSRCNLRQAEAALLPMCLSPEACVDPSMPIIRHGLCISTAGTMPTLRRSSALYQRMCVHTVYSTFRSL